VEAFKKARKNSISAEVREGGKRDAILHSVGANATHGLRLTNADKRRAVDRMLKDEEWAKWSDREIAKHCGVAPNTVGARRKKSSAQFAQKGKSDKTRTVKRGNTTYEQNTGSIGKGKQTSFRHDQQLPVDSPAPTGDAGFCTSESLRHLRKIEKNDPDRVKALLHVKNWIDKELETHSAPGSTHLP